MSKNILISDANHGGLVLLDEYAKTTKNNLFFYDTYNKLSDNEKTKLTEKYDVKFLNLEYIQEHINEFTTINPVHMKDLFKCNWTHHEFCGYLINKHKKRHNWNFKIVEVTGVKGKTTVVDITSKLLACDMNVLVLNSQALTYKTPTGDVILKEGLSITPASIITALNMAADNDLLDSIDCFIAEVSLGITGMCDVGVLTNIIENYPIGGGKSSASIAKKSVFDADCVLCDIDTYNQYYSDISCDNLKLISFNNPESCIFTESVEYNFDNTIINFTCNNDNYTMECFALSDFYVMNILFATLICQIIGKPIKSTINDIKSIKTLKGRGSYREVDGKIVLEDINAGLNMTSIKQCVNNIKRYSDNFALIIGGDYGITCEEIDEQKLLRYIKKLDLDEIVLTSSVGKSLYDELDNHTKFKYFKTLKDAFNHVKSQNKDFIQVIYRSKYSEDPYYI